ncbi:hypothetical protein ABE485_06235 [Achromobacter spanius]|uniref:hypothetical protein n=1 Tax=Achromobacter spanius TaxID=217203 RepID=UPI003209520D
MTTRENLKLELDRLLETYKTLHTKELLADRYNFSITFQTAYTQALRVVESLAKDRYAEFRTLYEIDPKRKLVNSATYSVQDFTQGRVPGRFSDGTFAFNHLPIVQNRIVSQYAILKSLYSRIDDILSNMSIHVAMELQDAELKAAEQLLRISPRASGALAGVVLERHLQSVAALRQVTVAKKNPTISDLNDPLKEAGAYDLPQWRRIQHLADLRNLCCHQKDREPTKDEARDLISGTQSVIANVM